LPAKVLGTISPKIMTKTVVRTVASNTPVSPIFKDIEKRYVAKDELVKLPGIGTKTANVMLIEYFKTPAFPIDTHVSRVSKRLNLCDENDNVTTIEKKLTKIFPQDKWARLHLQMVLFGRYICKATKPLCEQCLLKSECKHIRLSNK
jgi:endonuclease III